jgi:hypothetical protein
MGTTIGRRTAFGSQARFADLFEKWGGSDAGRILDEILDQLQKVTVGVPRLHADTHLDPADDTIFSTDPPEAIAVSASAGTDTKGAPRVDHKHPAVITTNGDILTVVAGALARLGVGNEDEVLAVVSGAPAWSAAADDAVWLAFQDLL